MFNAPQKSDLRVAMTLVPSQHLRISGEVGRLGERRAMASRVHLEGSSREGLQQSVQGQRAGCPQQLIVSLVARFFGAGI
jgi:hypothetical protein